MLRSPFKLRNKIILDRIVARPVAFLLNIIVYPLGKLLNIDHDDSVDNVKVIVVAKLLGMGSILRSVPLIKALKNKYPHARYVYLSTRNNRELIENLDVVDEGLYIHDTSLFGLIRDVIAVLIKLWKMRVDLYFDLEIYSAFSTILATFSLARNRYGFYEGATYFRLGLNTHLVYFNNVKHISRIYLQFAIACGIRDFEYKVPAIRLKNKHKEEMQKWLAANAPRTGAEYIIINPNASELLLERRWPIEYFTALIEAVALSWKGYIFLVGSPKEHCYVDSLLKGLSVGARGITVNSAGKISLMAAVALIYNSALMITVDSGLYHIGASSGVPVVSLWGPGDCRHYSDTESKNNYVFFNSDVYCSPCLYKVDYPPCRHNNICMKMIHPKTVYLKACELLAIAPLGDTAGMDRVYAKVNADSDGFDITVRVP